MAQAEFVATVAEAIKTRSVLRLIDATVRLNNAGTPVSARVSRLAFEASVLEETGHKLSSYKYEGEILLYTYAYIYTCIYIYA